MAAKKKAAKASSKSEYKVLSANTVAGIEEKVGQYLADGYRLVGGLQVAFPPFNALEGAVEERVVELFQAVAKDG